MSREGEKNGVSGQDAEITVSSTTNVDDVDIKFLHEELARLKEALDAANADAAKWKDECVRALAEYENSLKRHRAQLLEATKKGINDLFKDLIEILENVYRAQQSVAELAPGEIPLKVENILKGLELIGKQLPPLFKKYNVVRVMPQGETFDYKLHDAISQVSSPAHENNQIIEVIQAGYTVDDKLVRPAQVVVAIRDNGATSAG